MCTGTLQYDQSSGRSYVYVANTLRIPGEVLFTAFSNKWYKVLETSTCGVWFYLANLLMAILITVLLFLVVRRYKGRERDEITESQMLVEDIYYKYNNKR